MLRAACLGTRLVEDVLAGLAVVTGIPFGTVTFIQLLDLTDSHRTPFFLAVGPDHLHWDEPITELQLSSLQGILAHWDGLPMGGRLRRAASLYQRALQHQDDLAAFQYSYMGLEALEPVLAKQQGVSSGVEKVKGKCQKCGEEFVKLRSVLNGVRAYIRGGIHSERTSPNREREWKRVNELRQKQFHSLEDLDDLYPEARSILPAIVHFLHDAICCLSHAHKLESPEFRLARGARRMVFKGTTKPAIGDRVEDCLPVVQLKEVVWVKHQEYGYVPEIHFLHNRPGVDIGVFWLSAPLKLASEDDLEPARFETGGEPV